MIEKSLLATLRAHSSPITCIEPFYVPSTITYTFFDDASTEYPLLSPSVITADESGLIIWWNLSTRRPLGVWQAHTDSILTVQQLGITWDSNNSHDFNIPKISETYGQLLTHSKDGTIKIWKMINLIDNHSVKSGFTYSCLLKKKINSTTDGSSVPTPPLLYELPVNAMNFANVDMNSHGVLITPATTDSEGWDLYKIKLTETLEHMKLRRLIQNYQPKVQSTEKVVEIQDADESESSDLTKRGRLGVIMKVAWIDSTHFLVGYENGNVIGYELNQDIADSTYKAKICFHNKDLEGNAITIICHDKINSKVLCSSTGSKISIINVNSEMYESQIFETKHKGINSIDCDSFTNSVGIVTWDGYTRMYDYDQEKVLKFCFKMRRQLPAISNSKEMVDNENGDIMQTNGLQTQRASILRFTKKQIDPREVKIAGINIIYNNGRSKNIVRRNKEEIFGERWLFIGYQDGKVAMYSIRG